MLIQQIVLFSHEARQSLEAGNIYKYKYLSQATTFSSDELHVNSKFQI